MWSISVARIMGSPAHAGIDPDPETPCPCPARLPRPRGDRRLSPLSFGEPRWAPPPTRGSTRGGRLVRLLHGGSPACAGIEPEQIERRGPLCSFEAVELTTLAWVDRFNTRRFLGPIRHVPPADAEANYYAQPRTLPVTASPNHQVFGRTGAVEG